MCSRLTLQTILYLDLICLLVTVSSIAAFKKNYLFVMLVS